MLTASGIVSSFRLMSAQRVAWIDVHTAARGVAAIDARSPGEATRLRSDTRTENLASEGAKSIATTMSRPLSTADGIDPVTRRAVNATPEEAEAVRRDQNADSRRAEQAGARADRVTVAILLGALAASLGALASAARGKRATPFDGAAAGVLVMSLAALASVPFL
jgi:hypothetical protein